MWTPVELAEPAVARERPLGVDDDADVSPWLPTDLAGPVGGGVWPARVVNTGSTACAGARSDSSRWSLGVVAAGAAAFAPVPIHRRRS